MLFGVESMLLLGSVLGSRLDGLVRLFCTIYALIRTDVHDSMSGLSVLFNLPVCMLFCASF